MTRAIDRLATLVHDTQAGSIPAPVMERAADCILDAIGSAAGGAGARSTAAMSRALPRSDGKTAIWFAGESADPIRAATVNAMAATALDVDDGHRVVAGHPGAAIVAAALGAAPACLTGADLLAAVVLGYEVSVRVGIARVAEHHGSTVSGRWSGTGVAALAARLQGLPPATIAEAILIAEQHAPRLGSAATHGFAGSDVKEGIAWSVFTALHAVELAKSGFRAYPDTFEQGLLYSPDRLVAKLDDFSAIDGLFFKPYACCRWMHSAIDGLKGIMGDKGLCADEIARVTVRTFDQAVGLGNRARPNSEAEAQFSIPFCLAVTACRGTGALLPLDLALMGDEEVLDFGKRVTILHDDGMQALFPRLAGAIVEVETARQTFESRVEAAFGDPTNRMSRADLSAKFHKLTDPVIGATRAGAIADVLAAMRNHDAGALQRLLGAR